MLVGIQGKFGAAALATTGKTLLRETLLRQSVEGLVKVPFLDAFIADLNGILETAVAAHEMIAADLIGQ
jgi:hypothetical protein